MITAVPGVLVSFSDSCAIEFAKKVDRDSDGYITGNGGAVLGPRHMFITTTPITKVSSPTTNSTSKGKQTNITTEKEVKGSGKRANNKKSIDSTTTNNKYISGQIIRGASHSFVLSLPEEGIDYGNMDINTTSDDAYNSVPPDWSRVETLRSTLEILLDPSTLKKEKRRMLGRQQADIDRRRANSASVGLKRPRSSTEDDFSSEIDDVSDGSEERSDGQSEGDGSPVSRSLSESSSSSSSD
eukprot:Tbor_TRINITY_DN5765_c3_g2::TRINITY_DN5765_c3_g2_i11::g.20165::m.20165